MFLCLVFLMLLCLFIAALWSPAVKGLTSWFQECDRPEERGEELFEN